MRPAGAARQDLTLTGQTLKTTPMGFFNGRAV